jgi:hypothetical protein
MPHPEKNPAVEREKQTGPDMKPPSEAVPGQSEISRNGRRIRRKPCPAEREKNIGPELLPPAGAESRGAANPAAGKHASEGMFHRKQKKKMRGSNQSAWITILPFSYSRFTNDWEYGRMCLEKQISLIFQ